ncbi:MAG: SDR family NAD(P)-dependent oxidoreductase [Chloroflexota bacterium]
MDSKIILITGGTGGIGLETAKALAMQGAQIIVAGRSAERGAAAVEIIATHAGHDRVRYIQADLTRMDDTVTLARQIDRLDVLINNAGGLYGERHVTPDGFEASLAINHLAPFLLTHHLLDRLQASAPARIVNVSSVAHRAVRVQLDNLQAEHWDNGVAVYGRSKLVNLLVGYEHARQLEGSGVTLNFADPASADTEMTRQLTRRFLPPLIGRLLFLKRFIAGSPARSARSSIYLATAPAAAGQQGLYVTPRLKAVRSAPASYDPGLGRRLYAETEAMLRPWLTL